MTHTPTRATRSQPTAIRPDRGGRRAEVARGLSAALALAGLVIGIPTALMAVAPMTRPTTWPTLDQIIGALTSPDDGTLFIAALIVIAWAAWAAFTLSVLVEIAAQVRGLPTPRLPGLRASQRAAAVLVASIGLLVAPTGATVLPLATAQASTTQSIAPRNGFATLPPAPVHRADEADPAPTAGTARAQTPAPSRLPTVTVERGDSLWRLAERHLGDGERFTEIAALNMGRPQPDGRALTDANWIHPGWTLRLPADATVTAPPPRPAGASTESAIHNVVPGDTLWDISEDELGDGARYPEIYDLNAGITQPDGRTLTDPDLIQPGWRLRLPTAHVPAPTHSEAPTDVARPPGPDLGTEAAPPPDDQPADAAAPEVEGDREALTGDIEREGVSTDALEDDAPVAGLGQAFFLGLTALASAGIVGEIARRRRRQQRLRRTGERIPLPAPGTAAAAAERELRRAPETLKIEDLKRALHALAPACAAAGRDLPGVGVVRVSDHAVELLLTDEDPAPIPPFTSTAARTWTATHSELAATPTAEDLEDFPAPYPALVTIGGDEDAVILVNLEAAGTLSIEATDEEAARATLRAIACELATSSMSDRAVILVGPDLADLADATASVLLAAATSEATLAARLKTDTDLAARHLADGVAADTLHARSRRVADSTWNPTIYLGEHIDGGASPWAGLAVVTARTAAGGWHLKVEPDGSARLDPLGLDFSAARLTFEAYESLLELLRTAEAQPEREGPVADATAGVETVEALASLPRPAAHELPDRESEAAPSNAELAPRVTLLGPVAVTGTARTSREDRSRRNTEIVAHLALHPGASAAELDEIVGHGALVSTAVRNTTVSRVRGWLGKDPDDRPYLPAFSAEHGYRLDPAVTTDWDEFLALARRGLAAGPAGEEDLTAALSLVRGRPMSGVRPGTYDWAEAITQEMISTTADVAHVLASIHLETGDPAAAAEAAAIGLTVDICNEQLYRDAIAAARRRGDLGEITRLAANLRAHIEEIDPDGDLDDVTQELLGRVVEYRA